MNNRIGLILAFLLVMGGGYYFYKAASEVSEKPQITPPLKSTASGSGIQIEWMNRVDSEPGMPISESQQFDEFFYRNITLIYWPDMSTYNPPQKFESDVLKSVLLILKKYNNQGSMILHDALRQIGVEVNPYVDTMINKDQQHTPRYVWMKIKPEDMNATFLKASVDESDFFSKYARIPNFLKKISTPTDIAEFSANVVSEDGETGIINFYFYLDDSGNTQYTGELKLLSSKIRIRETYHQ